MELLIMIGEKKQDLEDIQLKINKKIHLFHLCQVNKKKNKKTNKKKNKKTEAEDIMKNSKIHQNSLNKPVKLSP